MASFVCFAVFVCSFLCMSAARSQYYFYDDNYYDNAILYEIGGSVGGMNCLTDLGGTKGKGKRFIKDINWNATRFCGGMYAAVSYHNVVTARFELALGQITASDNVLKNNHSAAYGRFARNLNFQTEITELSLHIECHPLQLVTNETYSPSFSPYFFTGIACFEFCPKAYYNNSLVKLPELHTEGQGFPEYKDRKAYRLTQLNLPLGCGIKYEVSAIFSLRFEMTYRKLWTDYLDDVSKTYIDKKDFDKHLPPSEAALARNLADRRLTSEPAYLTIPGAKRGNDKDNDAYFSFNLKTGLILGRQKRS